jgi:signal transduction histidine kinase/putative methionine-R-sulfoxide reductase with GAF domain
MTLVLRHPTERTAVPDLSDRYHQRVAGRRDACAAAAAAVELLGEALPDALCTVFRLEPETQSALVLAATPHHPRALAVGTRVLLQAGLMAAAAREGKPQRASDCYVDPDFGASAPGEPRSILVVPVGSGAHPGLLRLEYPAPARPGAGDQEVAERVAALLAESIGAGSEAEPHPDGADRQLRQLSILAVTAAQLAQSNDLSRSMQRLAESATELLDCEGAMLLLRHGSRPMLEVTAVAGVAPVSGGLVPLEGNVLGTVLQTAQPRTWARGTAESLAGPDAAAEVRAALAVPLIAGSRAFGTLAVVSARDDQPFSPTDLQMLQHLANQSAGIESIRLLQPLRQRLSDSSIVAEVGRAVTGTLGLDEVLALVVRAAEMLVNTQAAAVALIDERNTRATLEAVSGRLLRHQGAALPLDASLVGRVVRTGESVTTASFADEPLAHELEKHPGAGVVVPIESHNRVHGALLAVRRADGDAPSDEDVDALRKLAAYAAIAIDNARLYREQLQLSAALRTQAAELEKAYADLSESQERLLVSEKMAALGKVTAGIAHEINSPLGGILNCLQMAQSYVKEYSNSIGDPDVTPEDHRGIASDLTEALSLAEQSGKKVAQFVRTIKNQTRMDEVQRGLFDPAEEVAGTITLLHHELRNRNVTLHTVVEPDLKLIGDPGKFSLILQNLLTNAIDAYEGAAGEVWVRLLADGDGLRLEVEDHGCGIPEEIRGKVFDYLFTTKDVGQGTGLGLAMVHSIVTTNFDGRLDFHSEVGKGTTFLITFPAPSVRA